MIQRYTYADWVFESAPYDGPDTALAKTDGRNNDGDDLCKWRDVESLQRDHDWLARDIERARQMLSSMGVPRDRARILANGIDVLATRCGREAHDLRCENSLLHDKLRKLQIALSTHACNCRGAGIKGDLDPLMHHPGCPYRREMERRDVPA